VQAIHIRSVSDIKVGDLRKHGNFDILNYKLKRPDIQKLFERS